MNINDLPEVACNSCGWQGCVFELVENEFCPDCGSIDIEDYEPDEEELETNNDRY